MPASSCHTTLWRPSPLTSSGYLLLLWRLPSLLQTRLKRCAVHCCKAAGMHDCLHFCAVAAAAAGTCDCLHFNALNAGYPLPKLERSCLVT